MRTPIGDGVCRLMDNRFSGVDNFVTLIRSVCQEGLR
jgi:hypothetical protein